MTSSINHEQEYQQAQKAYIQGNYEEAGNQVDQLVQDFPDDPSSHLLRGHIYCVLQQYDSARKHYQIVLNLTEDLELIDCANNGLESVSQYESADQSASAETDKDDNAVFLNVDSLDSEDYSTTNEQQNRQNLGMLEGFDTNVSDFNYLEHNEESTGLEQPFGNSFGSLSSASIPNNTDEPDIFDFC